MIKVNSKYIPYNKDFITKIDKAMNIISVSIKNIILYLETKWVNKTSKIIRPKINPAVIANITR